MEFLEEEDSAAVEQDWYRFC